MTTPERRSDEINQLGRTQAVSLLEGTTLVLLVFVAVPLKHFAGLPQATRVMGAVHGLAFLFYVWVLIQTAASCRWSRLETARMLAAALVPFGAFLNERALARRRAALATGA